MKTRCRVLLVSGSLRARSTNTAVLRTVCALAPAGVEPVLYEGLGTLPPFNPDQDGDALPAAAAELREQIRAADALLFSIPEYAGALPASLKRRARISRSPQRWSTTTRSSPMSRSESA